ncbi:hypothetical protein [Pseudonocardia sp. McavD-2-B]|uniref:hypothetical protein n=1 Tax=Pseudonocardia sp. McavD-2-B TaxID=2954499 RepID=UPI0020981617|nr:hypothetical protein [Pseudonocardia sp. McavD-2-B]MCO7195613.1 hypothetical protein [Pseudonocardia sp. McavD-2-B]
MTPLARTALRLSLAGAGIAALGAGVVGQASAAELPEAPDAPDTSALPSYEDGTLSNDANSVSFGELQTPHGETSGLPELPSADALPGLPSTDALPSADSLPGAEDLSTASLQSADAPEVPSAPDAPELPSADDAPELPSADDVDLPSADDAGALPVFEVPGVMYIEAPTVS